MSKNFISIYKLETEEINKKQKKLYIEKCIENIHNQNLKQGKNGVYTLNNSNEYGTIRNIIKYDNIILETKEINKLMDVLIETICCERQTINAKNNAIQLIIYLKKNLMKDEFGRNTERLLQTIKITSFAVKMICF
ncbi:MAG: hypothetical protein ACLRYC_04210 [Clostridia bacterium]